MSSTEECARLQATAAENLLRHITHGKTIPMHGLTTHLPEMALELYGSSDSCDCDQWAKLLQALSTSFNQGVPVARSFSRS